MYARRRILAVLAVLLVLALLLPRACQALMGSGNEAGGGPGGERQAAGADAAGTGEGDGSDSAGTDDRSGTSDTDNDEDAGEAKDESSDRGAPFLDERSDGENGSGGEAAPDLLAVVAPTAPVGDEDAPTGDEGNAGGGSSGTGGGQQSGERPISEVQFALAASPPPAQQPSSGGERAPTRRSGPAETAPAETTPVAEQDTTSPAERIRARVDRLTATPPVAEPAALAGSRPRTAVTAPAVAQPAVAEPAVAQPAVVEPAAAGTFGAATVAPAPASQPVPVAVRSGPAFAPTPAVGALNGVGRGPGALPSGPRLAGPGPTGIPGPAF